MTISILILVVVAIQQGLFASAWGVVWALRLAPRVAPSFAASAALSMVGFVLVALHESLPAWIHLGVASILVTAATIAFRRGTQSFARQDTWLRSDLAILVLTAIAVLLALNLENAAPRIVISHLVMAAVAGQAAWIVATLLPQELGRRAAWLFSAPVWLIAALFVMRIAGAILAPDAMNKPLYEATMLNTVYMLVFMAASLATNMVVFAMVIKRVVHRLDHLTREDPMTGLLNRRAIEEALSLAAGRARRRKGQFALLALDIDHFKRINDEHGHPVGDAVLISLAQTLREFARNGDIVARAGGEEFWILAPNTDTEGASALAERVRLGVRRHAIHVGRLELTITTSVGVAVFEDTKETPQELFTRADQALYAAKAAGRNCVAMARPPSAHSASPSTLGPNSKLQAEVQSVGKPA